MHAVLLKQRTQPFTELFEKFVFLRVANLLMALSYKQKLKFTIFGYIRLNHQEEIPDDISKICLAYYNKIEIVWDLFCDNIKDCVSDDGLQIKVNKRTPYSTFASSIGWNEGIHSFTVQQLDSEDYQFAAGIMSSEGIHNVSMNDKEYYFTAYPCKYNKYTLDRSGVSANDKVTVVIDCNEWKVRWYKNQKLCDFWKYPDSRIKYQDIAKDKTYHAVITVWMDRNVSLKLIETEMDIENVSYKDLE